MTLKTDPYVQLDIRVSFECRLTTGQIRGGRSWHHHLWTLTHKPKHTSQEGE